MSISKDFIERVKAHGVLSIASKYTEMKQVSLDTWMGRCPNPEHEDSTPSFMVKRNSDGLESWACFGCHVGPKDSTGNYGSDNIAFTQWIYEKVHGTILTFPEAVMKTAAEFGIEMEIDKNSRLYELNKRKCKAYEANMNPGVLFYLKTRGLNEADIEKWHIGFNGERIIFPIFDGIGQIIGFSGRILPEAEGQTKSKYINSRNSAIFRKHDVFYGLNFTDKKDNRLLIAEGQMDTILAHKFGVRYTVSTMSCFLSESHINFIKEHSKAPILCYDGDGAGKNGMEKGLARLTNAGIKNAKVLVLPSGKDLADVALELNENLPQYVENNTITYSQYLLQGLANELDVAMGNKILEIMPRIKKILDSTNDPDEAAFAKKFIDKRLQVWIA